MDIRKHDTIRYGETKFCIGCRAVKMGKRGVAHTEECRRRLSELIHEHEPMRAEKDKMRSDVMIARKGEEEMREREERRYEVRDLREAQERGDGMEQLELMDEIKETRPNAVILKQNNGQEL